MDSIQISEGSFPDQRSAELEAGRARLRMFSAQRGEEEVEARERASALAIEEDDRQRYETLTRISYPEKVRLDRAASEVADQAQTTLEAALHYGDRRDRFPDEPRITAAGVAVPENHTQGRIQTRAQQRAIEELEGVDTELVHETTKAMVRAQAVGQPTPLAAARGLPTQGRALNISAFEDVELDTVNEPRVIPTDRMTPKTPEQAEEYADARTPAPEQVVKPGWHEPEKALRAGEVAAQQEEAAVARGITLDAAAAFRAPPNLQPENAFAAIDEVESWPEEVQPPEVKGLLLEGTEAHRLAVREGRSETPAEAPALDAARQRTKEAAPRPRGRPRKK